MSAAAKAQPSAPAADRMIRHPDGRRPRVLYAEDSPGSRVVTTAILERMGLDVHAVEDGEHALHAAEKASFDIILLDIEMPVMDGVTAARGIRALGGDYATTPILALSAFLADSTEASHWRGAFDQAVPKPANGNELSCAIRKALDASPRQGISDVRVDVSAPGGIADGLRSSLAPGLWSRLALMAAGESMHYANAAAFAHECGDAETLRRCLHSLRGLALSFNHPAMALTILEVTTSGASDEKLQQICKLAANWPSER